jgi:hypothetical protein
MSGFVFSSVICLFVQCIKAKEESTRETEEKLDGRNKEGHEREEPA